MTLIDALVILALMVALLWPVNDLYRDDHRAMMMEIQTRAVEK